MTYGAGEQRAKGHCRRGALFGVLALSLASTRAHAQAAPNATPTQPTQSTQAAQPTSSTQPAQTTTGAQTAPADPREAEARAAFEAGVAALTDERYADALRHFQRSYDVRRAASAALNLGVTLRALGRLVEARQRFNEFLELANEAQHERHDREVAQFIADIGRRVGRVRIAVVEPAGARVLIDGRRAARDERDEVVVDPGEHRVEAVLAGYDTAIQTVSVESGQVNDVQLRLRRAVIEQRVIVTQPTPPSRSGGIWTSPVFWVVIGVAVTAAVAIPVTVAVTSQPEIPRLSGQFCVRTDGVLCPTGGV
ncbi:MAG: PEGA domain-containing protein [Myxococcales bacterium]|nr:PEGA domain-containing protein [Myxococcales bacterium]